MGDEIHQRLKIARKRRFKTAKAAAEALGVRYGTYSGHELGSRGIKREDVEFYAKRFRVPFTWLATGEGSMEVRNTAPIVGIIGDAPEIQMFDAPTEQAQEAELPFVVPAGAHAVWARGGGAYPQIEIGDVIVVGNRVDPETLVGQRAVVRTVDGKTFFRKLARGTAQGLFHLESANSPLRQDVKIDWAEEVISIIPQKQWRLV